MDDILNTVSYDQYSDIPMLSERSKVIFGAQVYAELLKMQNDTNRTNTENGCFLVGRQSFEDTHVIYFDYCTSRFQCSDGVYSGGAVEPVEQNYNELKDKVMEYKSAGVNPCVMHFHVHPSMGFGESFSDQDYAIYASSAKNNNHCFNLGMLAFPVGRSTMGLSVVLAANPKEINGRNCADFYTIPNIYYTMGNSVYKVGSFEKNYTSRQTASDESIRQDRIVQNYRKGIGNKMVSGIGLVPNTNKKITDDNVGYVDFNGQIVITNENIGFHFPNVVGLNYRYVR